MFAQVLRVARGQHVEHEVVAAGADAKLSANWITGDIAAHVNSNRLGYDDLPFRPEQLAEMVKLIDGGKISGMSTRRMCAIGVSCSAKAAGSSVPAARSVGGGQGVPADLQCAEAYRLARLEVPRREQTPSSFAHTRDRRAHVSALVRHPRRERLHIRGDARIGRRDSRGRRAPIAVRAAEGD